MTLADFNALLEEHNIKPEVEPQENVPVVDLGIDSFEILMVRVFATWMPALAAS